MNEQIVPPASHVCRNGECDPVCIWILRMRAQNAGNYTDMIKRTPDGPDPLVKEPKK